jgi:hypothetical protein
LLDPKQQSALRRTTSRFVTWRERALRGDEERGCGTKVMVASPQLSGPEAIVARVQAARLSLAGSPASFV